MSGGPAFLRPVSEFSVRLCFVNFDGKEGLEESRRLGLDQPIGEDFVKTYCRPTYDGIQVSLPSLTQSSQTKYWDKLTFIYLFGVFMSLSTLYRSYHKR